MRALDLDLVRRRATWPAWVMLLVGVAMAADAGFGWLDLRDEVERQQQRRSGPQIAEARPVEPISDQTQRELTAARRTLDELALPWDALFASIEAALDKDTALLAIEPDAGKRVVRIQGEARSYPAVLALMQRLEQSEALGGMHLLNHQIREDVPERPYQFTMSGQWSVRP
ncbi:PilN domain-containing protein [Ideonella sp. A 288]|uniref:PilN domain-containing protein n=1 Tax=Ideonella sp. A 288 TaxID=1962181 RepID=UPI000B4A680A|nr:PilN domain-containing protein [Ideonella sp. A 288]